MYIAPQAVVWKIGCESTFMAFIQVCELLQFTQDGHVSQMRPIFPCFFGISVVVAPYVGHGGAAQIGRPTADIDSIGS